MSMARVVVCKECGKAKAMASSIRAWEDHRYEFEEIVREGNEQKDMPIQDARNLGMCDCGY